jgi:hypothetical protein
MKNITKKKKTRVKRKGKKKKKNMSLFQKIITCKEDSSPVIVLP